MTARKTFSVIPMNEVSRVLLLADKPDQTGRMVLAIIGIGLLALLIYGLATMDLGGAGIMGGWGK